MHRAHMDVMLLLVIVLISQTESIRFYVPPNGKKCLKEEIHKNVVVTGSYEFADNTGHLSSVHVSRPLYIDNKYIYIHIYIHIEMKCE